MRYFPGYPSFTSEKPFDASLFADIRKRLGMDSVNAIKKPRTYRQTARKEYLHTAQKKKKTEKQIRSAIRKHSGYLGRNLRSIHSLSDAYEKHPFNKGDRKYFYVIQTLYEQQLTMYQTGILC